MKNLNETTFIIPLKVEHEDRYRNAKTVLGFLNHHFFSNVILYEVCESGTSALDFIPELNNLKIQHIIDKDSVDFHRTKFLNIMLDKVESPVVVNYDIDVLLTSQNYVDCQDEILEGKSDVIYPYEFGIGQIMIQPNLDYEKFRNSGYNLESIPEECKTLFGAEYGHCIFFKTDIYRKFGGENEDFISYGPEDKERGERFKRFGTNVNWRQGYYVYHFEHNRGKDSSPQNPNFDHNWTVYNNINKLCETDFEAYENFYLNPPYSAKYSNLGKQKN